MRNDGISFEAAGKSRTLRFSTNAFCDLEDLLGIGMGEIIDRLQSAPTMSFLRACFWAGLRGSEPEITLALAGDVVDELGFADAAIKLGEAVNAAFPQAKAKDDTGNPPKPRTGTGTAS